MMRIRLGILGLMTAVSVNLAACAHSQAQRELNAKVQSTAPPADPGQLVAKTESLILQNPDLSPGQKNELLQLRRQTSDQSRRLDAESLKLKDILITDSIQPSYNRTEVDLIKKRLRKIENERLDMIFAAVDRVDQILGRNYKGAAPIVRPLGH